MLLIPAIDLAGGRCVRLRQGDFNQETCYPISPRELLKSYQALGARWIHVVDLDGAKDGLRANHPVIKALAAAKALQLQVGGGVRRAATIKVLLDAGAARVVIGSAAVQRPQEVLQWLQAFWGRATMPGIRCPRRTHRRAARAHPRLDAAPQSHALGRPPAIQ